MRCHNWLDARPQLMLEPSDATQGQLRYKVKRNGHLYTVMPAISLCGDTLPPLLVTKRLSLNIQVHATGLREKKELIKVHGRKGCINTLISRVCVIDMLLPYVDSLRPNKLGADQEAKLIMENLAAHKNVDTLEILRRSNVRPVFIPAHSSHALQVEDLITFAVLKGEIKKQTMNQMLEYKLKRLLESKRRRKLQQRNSGTIQRSVVQFWLQLTTMDIYMQQQTSWNGMRT
ncbi:MAG: hypothetical protein EZS28_026701 [Streblomastix strix]|uniref:DDE-1 domain-containing protein n=1 Tax=Streblomastix strix TaxID=222440 RepID=A0A5J4V5W5_9EUKA|nr:MAG: hypothetical protein EZS28_026701 [Streblomastix strix]